MIRTMQNPRTADPGPASPSLRWRPAWARPGPRRAALWASLLWTSLTTLLLSWAVVAGRTPELLQRIDLWLHDQGVRATLAAPERPQVTVLALDEKALARHGQWPWPRDLLAEVVRRLFDEHGARVLAFDIVFAEPDRSDAALLRQRLQASSGRADTALRRDFEALLVQLDRDAVFARSLQGRPVVMGYYFTPREGQRVGALPPPSCRPSSPRRWACGPSAAPGTGPTSRYWRRRPRRPGISIPRRISTA